jgi:ribosomal protein S18 acetylase RimI-like enzyme
MIRPALSSDAPGIAHIHVTGWQHAYRGHLPDEFLGSLKIPDRERMWAAILKESAHDLFVSISEGGVIEGFVHFGAFRDGDAASDRYGEVYTIYRLPDLTRRGIGRALMRSAEEELWRRGYTDIALWVLKSNVSAQAFYEAMGYHVDGAPKAISMFGCDMTEVRYRKGVGAPTNIA